MKLIEALKQEKDLERKLLDLAEKVATNSAHLNYETPMYSDPPSQVSSWIQAHHDILKEILRLRIAVQRTNLAKQVTIELGGRQVTKSIAEWIHRRRDLADKELYIWNRLTDRGLKEGFSQQSTGETVEVKIVRNYDPVERDRMRDLFSSEASLIDAKLEIVNAVTDLIE